MSRELPEGMKWEEFRDLENFTPEQHRIRNEWKSKHAEFIKNHTTKEQMDAQLDAIKMAFMRMAGLGGD